MSSLKAFSPYLCMFLCQLAYGAMNILLKIAMQQGLSHHVLVAYRHLLAWAISSPLAFVLERSQRPSLSFPILVKIFFLALFGITIPQNIYFDALSYTSPTMAGAMCSVIPALTFILAVLLRMEKVRIRTVKGIVKILGTLFCVTGALVITFWKGQFLKGFVERPLIIIHDSHFGNGRGNWVRGLLLILTSQIAFSAWIVFQGIVMSFFVYNLQIYCISEKGPLFSAIFFPVMLVILGIFSAIFYAERLHLGSLIGAIIIIIGLYCVLWGKSEDWHEPKKKESKFEEKETQINTQNSSPCNGANHV